MKRLTNYELACLQEKIGEKLTSEEKQALDAMFLDNMMTVVDTVLMSIKNNIPTALIDAVPDFCNYSKEANENIKEIVSNFRNE